MTSLLELLRLCLYERENCVPFSSGPRVLGIVLILPGMVLDFCHTSQE